MNMRWYHWAGIGVGVVAVGYGISRAMSARSLEAPAQPYTAPPPERRTNVADSGTAEERIASGAFGLAREITQGIFAKVARDDAARERAASRHSADMDKTALLDPDEPDTDYDPHAALARKNAAH